MESLSLLISISVLFKLPDLDIQIPKMVDYVLHTGDQK